MAFLEQSTDNPLGTDVSWERYSRKPNFSKSDTQFLLSQVKSYKSILIDKATDCVTNEHKREIWQAICDGLNKRNQRVYRSVDEIRKRWQNMVCTARKEAARIKNALPGGPPAPAPSQVSLQILALNEDWKDFPYPFDEEGGVSPRMKVEIDIADDDSVHSIPYILPTSPEVSVKENSAIKTSAPTLHDSDSVTVTAESHGSDMSVAFSFETSPCMTPVSSGTSKSVTMDLVQEPSGKIANGLPLSSTSVKSVSVLPAPVTTSIAAMQVPSKVSHPSVNTNKRRLEDRVSDLQQEMIQMDGENIVLDKKRLKIEKEKLEMEKEQIALQRQKLNIEREKLTMEKEIEREKLRLEQEKFAMEKEQERQKLHMEKEMLAMTKKQQNEKLQMDRERFEIEKEKLGLEQERLTLEISYWKRKLAQTRVTQENGINHTLNSGIL